MNNLFGFGCSYTAGWDLELASTYVDYKEWRGGSLPKVWLELLSEKLNLNPINYGKGGAGNDFIFHTFIDHMDEIKKGDTVIIGWSYMSRYRWAQPLVSNFMGVRGNWLGKNWLFNGVGDMSEKIINKITHEEICVNRTHPLYLKDIDNYMDIIYKLSKLVGFDVFFWSSEDNIIYNKPLNEKSDKKYLMGKKEHNPLSVVLYSGGQRIVDETNNKIYDFHMADLGHQVQCDLFYNHIMSKII